MIGLSVSTTTEYESTSEDNDMLSSGYSTMWWEMGKYDNYENATNYMYKSKQYSLTTKDFSFYDDVDFFREIEMENTPHYPQGICFTDEFLFVTAYAEQKDALGKIFVYDANTGEYLVTLAMDAKSHMGGIAYDGENLWICNSSKMALERISYEMIIIAVSFHQGRTVDIQNMVELYEVGITPSTVTYYDGKLWVAAHTKYTSSKMGAYVLQEEADKLKQVATYKIPSKVQGVAFSEKGEVYFSSSYGRKNSSHIRKYDSLEMLKKGLQKYADIIELPPCSEGICLKNERLYVVFESAGEKYAEGTDGYGKCSTPLDKILIISET